MHQPVKRSTSVEAATVDRLIKQLRDKEQQLAAWFRPIAVTEHELIRLAVRADTFRAFHGMLQPPSVVFRSGRRPGTGSSFKKYCRVPRGTTLIR